MFKLSSGQKLIAAIGLLSIITFLLIIFMGRMSNNNPQQQYALRTEMKNLLGPRVQYIYDNVDINGDNVNEIVGYIPFPGPRDSVSLGIRFSELAVIQNRKRKTKRLLHLNGDFCKVNDSVVARELGTSDGYWLKVEQNIKTGNADFRLSVCDTSGLPQKPGFSILWSVERNQFVVKR